MPKGKSGKSSRIRRSAALTSKLNSVENIIMPRDTEKAVILDDNGNVVFEKSGNEEKVSFNSFEIQRIKGNTLTHNHPEYDKIHTVFSPEDLSLAIKANPKEIRAVNQISKVSFGINKSSRLKDINVKNEFLAKYADVIDKTNAELTKLNKHYKKNIQQRGATRKERERYLRLFAATKRNIHRFLYDNQKAYGYIYSERSY